MTHCGSRDARIPAGRQSPPHPRIAARKVRGCPACQSDSHKQIGAYPYNVTINRNNVTINRSNTHYDEAMTRDAPEPWLVQGQRLFVYVFHYIDHTPGFTPGAVYDMTFGDTCEARLPAIKQLFIQAGWEGDGKIEVFAIPPVVLLDAPDGFLIWHVKQGNNGTSWLASEKPLPGIDQLVAVPPETQWP